MELNHFTETATVLNADCDFHRKLKPSALFRYVEQAAADHARAYGMDDDFFAAHHTAFLVGKQAVEIYRMPTRAEKITLDTACEPCKKGSMKRITHILDEAGKELALVDCRWIVVNTEMGHIMRQPSWCTPNYENEDLEGELPQLGCRMMQGADPGGQLDGQLLAVRPERPCEQLVLSGHRLRRPAAGCTPEGSAALRLHQVPPRDPDGGAGGGGLCAVGRRLVCGGPPGRAHSL